MKVKYLWSLSILCMSVAFSVPNEQLKGKNGKVMKYLNIVQTPYISVPIENAVSTDTTQYASAKCKKKLPMRFYDITGMEKSYSLTPAARLDVDGDGIIDRVIYKIQPEKGK